MLCGLVCWFMASPFCARLRDGFDRIDDRLIAGATAVVPARCARGLCRGWGRRRAPSSSCAVSSMAGVQKPHCSALRRRNASCRSAMSPESDTPSMVSTFAPSHCTASVRQPRTISPSTRTVQAPHTPCSQPTWLPVSPSVSRTKSTSVVRGSTDSATASPFTVMRISSMLMRAAPRAVSRRAAAARRRDASSPRRLPGCRSAGSRSSALTASSTEPSASAASALRARTGVSPTPK